MRELKLRPVAADPAITEANEKHAKSLGLRKLEFPLGPHRYKLAVVGGGPSILRKWDEIREFDCVLAINSTHKTLKRFGIDSTFVTVDPDPVIAEFAKGATSAIVATRCAPEVFEALKSADVRWFDLSEVRMGTATASTCLDLGVKMGFRKIVFFGCECSFNGPSHADRDEDRASMVVHADGKDWITAPDLYLQAQELSAAIRANPVFGERSGGMLRAMVHDKNFKATKMRESCLSS